MILTALCQDDVLFVVEITNVMSGDFCVLNMSGAPRAKPTRSATPTTSRRTRLLDTLLRSARPGSAQRFAQNVRRFLRPSVHAHQVMGAVH